MGYYAHGSGEIRLKSKMPDEVISELQSFDDAEQYSRKYNGVDRYYLFVNHYDDKYRDDDVYSDLEKIKKYALEGSVDFQGEDDCVWRFRFDPESGEFIEESGRIVYNFDDKPTTKKYTGNKLEFLCSIIEVFETFLDEKGISIPNPEKKQDDDASNIYGTDYGDLESELESLLTECGVLGGDLP